MPIEHEGAASQANRTAQRHALALAAEPGVVEAVPGARSVLVRIAPGVEPSPALLASIRRVPPAGAPDASGGNTVRIPVAYGGADGPDLADVATACGMSQRDVVALHSGTVYRPAFFGFLPGFAYLLEVPGAIRIARRDTPRTAVPPGSVAIAGSYTAVYPGATPGGWRLIGRTDVAMFDPDSPPHSPIAAAAAVVFEES